MRIQFMIRAMALALTLVLLPIFTLSEEETLYVENRWDFVDGSLDVSQGIPEDAVGVLARIRETGELRVATEPYFPPQEFIDPVLDGQERFVGADMELARRIAGRMGVVLVIVPMEFTHVLTAVAEGECDLAISALSYTPGRASLVELSKGYFFSESGLDTVLLVRAEDAESITDISDLNGRDIAAQSGSLQETLLAEGVTDYRQFRRPASIQAVYSAMQEGLADAAAVDMETARAYIQNNPDCGLALVTDVSFQLEEQFRGDRVAAKKGELQLMYCVNGVIDEVTDSGLYRQWYDESSDYAASLGL